jgi:hypothetical protein
MMALFLSLTVFAKDLPGEEVYVARPKAAAPLPKAAKQKHTKARGAILPLEYLLPLKRESNLSELVSPPKGSRETLRQIRVGDLIDLRVQHSVIAFPDERSPVIAVAEAGSSRGLRFIGESYLEKNTHRIFVEFTRVVQGEQVFNLKGVAVSEKGQPGLVGEYHSREALLFAGDFTASFVAGYFDGLVPRQRNVFGQMESDQSVDAAVKKGLASGALSTAERFREKLKKVPEFSEIQGPFDLKILVLAPANSEN